MPCFEVLQLLNELQIDDPEAKSVADCPEGQFYYASSQQNDLYPPYYPLKFLRNNGVSTISLYDGPDVIETCLTVGRLETITNHFLQEIEKQQHQIIGNFLQCNDFGVLITGESGSGKSLLSLAMIDRGHQLIADDITLICHPLDSELLVGYAPALLAGFIHTRQAPIINLPVVMGVQKVSTHHKIDLIVHLDTDQKVRDNLSTEWTRTTIDSVAIDQFNLNHHGIYSTALLIELLIKDRKSRDDGYNSTLDFHKRQTQLLNNS